MYIAAPRNTAYSNHHASTSLLSSEQLITVLLEHYTKDEWACLLHSLNVQADEQSIHFDSTTEPTDEPGPLNGLGQATVSAITTSHKQKQRADKNTLASKEFDPSLILGSRDSDLSEFYLIPIPSKDDNYSSTPEDKLNSIILQLDLVVGNVNKLSSLFKQFQDFTSNDLDGLDEKILAVDARIGQSSKGGTFDGCASIWDCLTLLHGEMSTVVQTMPKRENAPKAFKAAVDNKIAVKMALANT